jgi:hypothetical protein
MSKCQRCPHLHSRTIKTPRLHSYPPPFSTRSRPNPYQRPSTYHMDIPEILRSHPTLPRPATRMRSMRRMAQRVQPLRSLLLLPGLLDHNRPTSLRHFPRPHHGIQHCTDQHYNQLISESTCPIDTPLPQGQSHCNTK